MKFSKIYDKITLRKNFRFYIGCLLLILVTGMAGCRDDLRWDEDYEDDNDLSDVIRIKAYLGAPNNTRTYYGDQEQEVVEGKFYFYYPKPQTVSQSGYAVFSYAFVDFGNVEDPATGFVAYDKDGVLKDLKWRHVYNSGNTQFKYILHNINPNLYSSAGEGYHPGSQGDMKFIFKYATNPYVASPLDTIDGTNDMIINAGPTLGSSIPYYTVSSGEDLVFNLYHCMSLMKLNIEVYSSSDGYNISLDNAIVEITNLYRNLRGINFEHATYNSYYRDSVDVRPQSQFYRSDYNEYTNFGNVVMVGDKNESTHYDWKRHINPETGEEKYYFESPYQYSEEGGEPELFTKRTYSVQDFVFPPQPFKEGDLRPEVIIRVPKEDVTHLDEDKGKFMIYRGYLPNYMYEADQYGNATNLSPLATRLSSGYVLHVNATIDSPNSELSFSPVTVEHWMTKGNFTLSTKKSGIYNSTDLQNLVQTYNEVMKNGNTYELEKFGFKSGDVYVFQIWSNFTVNLQEQDLTKTMPINPDNPIKFIFILNDFTLNLDRGDDNIQRLYGIEGQQELYKMVTGQENGITYTGVTSSKDMIDLINLCYSHEGNEEYDFEKLLQYGNHNTYDNYWMFNLEDDIEVNLEDIYQKIDNNFLVNTFNLNLKGHKIIIKIGDKYLEAIENGGTDNFTRLAVKNDTFGIYSPEDFYLLQECYNNFYEEAPDLLTLFGSKSSTSDSWTFRFRKNMTLDGTRVFGSMTPDPENNKPDFSTYTTSSSSDNVTITFDHPEIPFSRSTSSQLSNLLKGTSHSYNQQSFSSYTYALNVYYNANDYYYLLYAYGRYEMGENGEHGKWVFTLDYKDQFCYYNYIFGSMIPDIDEGKFDYDIILGNTYIVRDMPNSLESSSVSYHYFYQDGTSTSSYPNTAADFKKLALGTYWDEDEEETPAPPGL